MIKLLQEKLFYAFFSSFFFGGGVSRLSKIGDTIPTQILRLSSPAKIQSLTKDSETERVCESASKKTHYVIYAGIM